MFPQKPEGYFHLSFHGIHTNLQGVGDLLVFHIVKSCHQKYFPAFVRQAIYRTIQQLNLLSRFLLPENTG